MKRMPVAMPLLTLLIALPLATPALYCQESGFSVRVRVLPDARHAALLEALPLPAGARALGTTRERRQAVLEQPPPVAASHFRTALASLGWHLREETTAACGSVEQHWENAGQRLHISLRAPLGGFPATLIGLSAEGS